MNNPLLDFSGLPRFPDIEPAHVTPAVEQLIVDNRALVERLVADVAPPAWDNFVRPLEDANERLSRAWGQVSHLNAVMNSPELREVYNANLPTLTAFYADLSQHQGLFDKFKALKASPAFDTLTPAQKKIVANELRDFVLGGADLAEDKKGRFKAIQEELSTLSAKFEENLLDTTNAFALFVESEDELTGIPADALQVAREAAQADGKAGWKFTLHMPSYMPLMQYGENRKLREQMYYAYVTRASEFGKPELDNTALITQILKLRREAAQMLGFNNYAEESLATKMAETPQQVLDFLNQLGARAKPYAERDLADLRQFAREEMDMDKLEAWDVAYASEKMRLQRYAFSDQEVKQYFPENKVLPGMFKVVETIYGLSIHSSSAPVWHQDVKFFDIRDQQNQLVGQFYLDLYARQNKRGGAWMDDAITRRRKESGIQVPVTYLNCNFAAPVGDKPALFTHDEVITLFHEFGHGLHHMLTRVEDLGVSGINGVEWDAVELPSQFMENFCWEWDVLKHLARHVDSGELLPRALFDKMLAAKNFQGGLQTVRQLEFALFDMHLHADFDPAGTVTPLQLLERIRAQIAVLIPPAYNRFPNNFSHIFAGGYGAGYYSYKWAEVLSADAYSLFEENGVLSEEVGHRFWSEILGVGGSRSALESFVAFRGREPSIDALLRHNGMV
ncbi:oligopeptidase A [Sulfurimicrobium lacus]|uniref:oligopeptidase A n=1 Tax=Sulfurimicrobium lacus TaxID=2715678 RepID=A0A6F8V8Y1_9PROT|nr:M3 family metallopeptidase [Sulfurimicrobium lacus]BCB25229.1 oligopeptidase A [Sulfurimicrobium lacus]